MLCGQASLLQQSSGGARVSKFVIYTYALYWSRMLFTEQRAYGFTQSANHTVFFTGDYFAAVPGCGQDDFFIQWFDSSEIDHTGTDP